MKYRKCLSFEEKADLIRLGKVVKKKLCSTITTQDITYFMKELSVSNKKNYLSSKYLFKKITK